MVSLQICEYVIQKNLTAFMKIKTKEWDHHVYIYVLKTRPFHILTFFFSLNWDKFQTNLITYNTLKITYFFNISTTDTAVNASNPVVGSSRKRYWGSIINSIPILVLFRSPPLTPRMKLLPTCNVHYNIYKD